MNLFDLTDKMAIITGTSGNFGPIWKETLLNAGACVLDYDLPDHSVINLNNIKHLQETIENAPKDVLQPSILVNNAAIDNPPGSKTSFFGNFKEIIDVNLIGAINMCEAVIPLMIKNGGGVIINIGSIMGSRGAVKRNYPEGFEKPSAYNCSKAALIQLSRSITTQYGDKNIRSVTIGFGPYDGGKLPQDFLTKFLRDVPLNRTISKQSLQATLLYACCCPELAGQLILVDAGFCA